MVPIVRVLDWIADRRDFARDAFQPAKERKACPVSHLGEKDASVLLPLL